MRPLLSYDDISGPQQPQIGPQIPLCTHREGEAPSKRRKQSNQTRNTSTSQHAQHWDDHVNHEQEMNYGDEGLENGEVDGDADGESRELTYDEIWDDSALIEAWNAATEEYEIYHGPEKNWKKEPVNKSPLWYNIPPSLSKRKRKAIPAEVTALAIDDSTPQNFETFVPDHDPTLRHPSVPSVSGPQQRLPDPPGPLVSRDGAFDHALEAMYWSGYWTAVYHCHTNRAASHPLHEGDDEQAGASQDENVDAEEGYFVSTQR